MSGFLFGGPYGPKFELFVINFIKNNSLTL